MSTTTAIKTSENKSRLSLRFLFSWLVLALAFGLIYAIPIYIVSPEMETWARLAAMSGLTGAMGGFWVGVVAGVKGSEQIPSNPTA